MTSNTSVSSDKSCTSDSSAVDSDDNETLKQRKRYKRALDLDYKPYQVSSLTRRRWKNNRPLPQVLNNTAVMPSALGIPIYI